MCYYYLRSNFGPSQNLSSYCSRRRLYPVIFASAAGLTLWHLLSLQVSPCGICFRCRPRPVALAFAAGPALWHLLSLQALLCGTAFAASLALWHLLPLQASPCGTCFRCRLRPVALAAPRNAQSGTGAPHRTGSIATRSGVTPHKGEPQPGPTHWGLSCCALLSLCSTVR